MLTRRSKALLAITIALAIAGISADAMADTQWDKNHPARDQVNDRLHTQNKRIHKQVKTGAMSHRQARRLHQQDVRIRQEERDMASQNDGRINQREQNTLNQQENRISQRIGQ